MRFNGPPYIVFGYVMLESRWIEFDIGVREPSIIQGALICQAKIRRSVSDQLRQEKSAGHAAQRD